MTTEMAVESHADAIKQAVESGVVEWGHTTTERTPYGNLRELVRELPPAGEAETDVSDAAIGGFASANITGLGADTATGALTRVREEIRAGLGDYMTCTIPECTAPARPQKLGAVCDEHNTSKRCDGDGWSGGDGQ